MRVLTSLCRNRTFSLHRRAFAGWCSRNSSPCAMVKFVLNSSLGANTYHTEPASRAFANTRALLMFFVITPPASPYFVLLARSITSSKVWNLRIVWTGPKIYMLFYLLIIKSRLEKFVCFMQSNYGTYLIYCTRHFVRDSREHRWLNEETFIADSYSSSF